MERIIFTKQVFPKTQVESTIDTQFTQLVPTAPPTSSVFVPTVDEFFGYYQELYGGFYQGFYKLKGYDYEVMPERMNKGWTVEMVLKPRLSSQFDINTQTEEYLNTVYPKNSGTFFFFGSRADSIFILLDTICFPH